jgi:outer membrane murein-binding lipoprotein Lpp
MRSLLVAIAAFTLLAGCGGHGGGGRYADYDDPSSRVDAAAEDVDRVEEEAKQAVYEERGADSDGTGADSTGVDAADVEDSGNYVCTEDCSGHEAGFEWAQDNDVTDASECGGNSQSFAEGCEAFAEERQEQADRDAQEAAEQAAEDARYEAEQDANYEDDDDSGRLIEGRYGL